MLRNRVYTALGLAALTILTIFAAPLWLVGLVFAVAAAVGAYEWAAFAGLVSTAQRLLYVAGAIVLGILLQFQQALWQDFVLFLCLTWIAGFVTLLCHPRYSNIYRNRWLAGVLGWVLMLGAWVSLMALVQLEHGKLWLFWMFVLTTATDVGAFFAGRAYGVNALAPKLSPGKTREGALGGIALALGVCVSALVLTEVLPLYEAIGLTLTMSIISVFGDLFESLLKRVSGVKDSGDILPGHGGVLDRIDSIIAVLPFLVWSLI